LENFLFEICKIVNNMPYSENNVWVVSSSVFNYIQSCLAEQTSSYPYDPPAVSTKGAKQTRFGVLADILLGNPIGVMNTKNNCIEEIIEYERIDKENIKLPSGEIVNIENIYKL
jgi:hypothetical protein